VDKNRRALAKSNLEKYIAKAESLKSALGDQKSIESFEVSFELP